MAKFNELFAPKDLTEGTPWKRITEFAIPMLIGNIVQQFYNTADSIIVGKYVGDNALAAVGSAGPILNLLLVLFVGISVGASIMVSQYFGAKDREKLSHTIGTCITLTAIASIIIMIIGPIVTKPMLTFLNTPDSIIDWSTNYLIIYFVGIAGFAYYNILAGVLRGLGDSISALGFLLISTILNVILDIWFVAGLNMGVPGVALATIIAQSISAILCMFKLMKMKNNFDLNRKMLKLNKQHSYKLIKLGLPSGITQAIFSLAMIAVQSLTNSFGEMVIAANVIIMRVDGFAVMSTFSFGTAMSTFTGQNIGAKKIDRVEKGTRHGLMIAVGISTIITILILIFGRYLISVFTDTLELVDLSMNMMRILAAGYIAMAVTQSLFGVMRGAGDTMTPMWVSLINVIIIRVPVAYGIAYLSRSDMYPTGRPESTFIALLVSWVMGSLLATFFYKKGAWRKNALTSELYENA